MATTEPIRDLTQLRALADYFLEHGQLRNYTMVVLGTCTALRIGDLLNLRWDAVYDKQQNKFRKHITITEKKTGKQKTFTLNEQAIDALRLYLPCRRGEFIFVTNRKKSAKPITRVQAWRIIHGAANKLGIMENVGCHSLRKTWGYHAWTSGEVSPVVITEIYMHASFETTKRYLGVAQDELDDAYTKMRLF